MAGKTEEFGAKAICWWYYRESGLEITLAFSLRVRHGLGFLPLIQTATLGPVTPEKWVCHCITPCFDANDPFENLMHTF